MADSSGSNGQLQRTLDEKVAIFKRYIEGRQDVFNIDKTPYDQVDADPNVKVKKRQWLNVDKLTDQRIPLTDDDIRNHILGSAPIAIFQKLVDDTVKFVTVDFDHPWDYSHVVDVQSYIWKELGVPCYIAKSSRKGWHLLFFFKDWTDFKYFTSFWAYVLIETPIDGMVQSEEFSGDGKFFLYPEVFPRPSSYGDGDLISLKCGSIKPPMVEPRMANHFNAFHKEFEPLPVCVDDQWAYLDQAHHIDPDWFKKKIEELSIAVAEPTVRRKVATPTTNPDGTPGPELHEKEKKPKGSFQKVLNGCPALKEAYEMTGRAGHSQRLALGVIAANCKDGEAMMLKLCETNPEHWQKDETEKSMEGIIGKYKPYTCRTLQLNGVCKVGIHPVKGDNKDHCLESREVAGEKISPSPYRFAVQRTIKESVSFALLKTEVLAARELIEDAARRGLKPGTHEYDRAFVTYKEAVIAGYLMSDHLEDRFEQDAIRQFLDSETYISKSLLKEIKREAIKRRRSANEAAAAAECEPILGKYYAVVDYSYRRTRFDKDGHRHDDELTDFIIVIEQENVFVKNLHGESRETSNLTVSGYVAVKGAKRYPFYDVPISVFESSKLKPLFDFVNRVAGTGIVYLESATNEIRNCIMAFNKKHSKIKKIIVLEDHGWHGETYITSNMAINKDGIILPDSGSIQLSNGNSVRLAVNKWEAMTFKMADGGSNAPRFAHLPEAGAELSVRAVVEHLMTDFLAYHMHEVTMVGLGHTLAASIQKLFPDSLKKIGPTLFLVGRYSSGKTETTRGYLHFYGPYEQMFNWQDSEKHLTDNLFLFGGMVQSIDDFKKIYPERKPISVVQLLYDRHGRAGQTLKGEARPGRTADGFGIVNGEDAFENEPSATSRSLFCYFDKYNLIKENKIQFAAVTKFRPYYSSVTPHFIHFALNLPHHTWSEWYQEARDHFEPVARSRTVNSERLVNNVSISCLGMRTFLEMAQKKFGVIDETSKTKHISNLVAALSNVLIDTMGKLADDDAGVNFLRSIATILYRNPNQFYIEGLGIAPDNNIATRLGFCHMHGGVVYILKESLDVLQGEFKERKFQSIKTISQALFDQGHTIVTPSHHPFYFTRVHEPGSNTSTQKDLLAIKWESLFPGNNPLPAENTSTKKAPEDFGDGGPFDE